VRSNEEQIGEKNITYKNISFDERFLDGEEQHS
jgi:hypothetical protein